jgi:hypothetical protein
MKFTTPLVLAALFGSSTSIRINTDLISPSEIMGAAAAPETPAKVEVPAVMKGPEKVTPPSDKLTDKEIFEITSKAKAEQDARNEDKKNKNWVKD